MTSASGSSSLALRRMASPSTSSIFISVTTTSKFSDSMSDSPRRPEVATVQSLPIRVRLSATAWACDSSSSTISTWIGIEERSAAAFCEILAVAAVIRSLDHRERNGEPGAAPDFTLAGNRAAMGLHNSPHGGQPQSAPVGFGGEEHIKHFLSRVLIHSGAVVDQAQAHAPVLHPRLQFQQSAAGHGLLGVERQIHQHLPHQRGVD